MIAFKFGGWPGSAHLSRFTFRELTCAISRSTESLKLSFLNGSPPQRPHFSTSIVSVSASSSVPYHAMKRAWQFSQ
jgi:hypothetical protein